MNKKIACAFKNIYFNKWQNNIKISAIRLSKTTKFSFEYPLTLASQFDFYLLELILL